MSENHSTTHNPQTSNNPQAAEDAPQGVTTASPHEPTSSAQFDLVALQAQNKELADQFLRAKAETNNARKRAEEEILKARKFAIENFAESLLPVADSLEAGLAIKDGTADQIREGAQATLRQLQTALERNKVFAIQPMPGSKFDPHQHQAISVVPSSIEAGAIVSVLQKGYLIADRVLRPALVTVSGAGEQATTK